MRLFFASFVFLSACSPSGKDPSSRSLTKEAKVHPVPSNDSKVANVRPDCKVNWADLTVSLKNLPEDCVDHLPDAETAESEIKALGLDPESFEETLFILDFLKDEDESKELALGTLPIQQDQHVIDVGVGTPSVSTQNTCSTESFSKSARFQIPLTMSTNLPQETVYSGCLAFRCRTVVVNTNVQVTGSADMNGTASGNSQVWSLNASGNLSGSAQAQAQLTLFMTGRRGQNQQSFSMGTARAQGAFSAADQVQANYQCATGLVGAASQKPNVDVRLQTTLDSFNGFVFPNMDGPLIQRVRAAIRQKIEQRIQPTVQAKVNGEVQRFVDAYQSKKQSLVQELVDQANTVSQCIQCVRGVMSFFSTTAEPKD